MWPGKNKERKRMKKCTIIVESNHDQSRTQWISISFLKICRAHLVLQKKNNKLNKEASNTICVNCSLNNKSGWIIKFATHTNTHTHASKWKQFIVEKNQWLIEHLALFLSLTLVRMFLVEANGMCSFHIEYEFWMRAKWSQNIVACYASRALWNDHE